MSNYNDSDIESDEAAEILGISANEAYYLPIPYFLEPPGYIWYRRRDVERLRSRGWTPKPELDDDDPRDEDDWDGPPI